MMFDKGAFNSLIDNDKELFQNLLDLFADDWPKIISNLKSALASNDAKAIEQNGHRIKGNLRNFYASELSELALSIEESGRNGNTQGVDERVNLLEQGLQKLEADLKQHFSNF